MLPFNGIDLRFEKTADGLKMKEWVNKYEFSKDALADKNHPLHRYGTEELKKISEMLGQSNLPEGQLQLSGQGVNELLEDFGARRNPLIWISQTEKVQVGGDVVKKVHNLWMKETPWVIKPKSAP
jgi:hypothetical protein